MASLWQFGDEDKGMLIVAADTAEEACVLRDEWLIEQKRLDAIEKKWWRNTQKFRKPNGWVKDGFELAKEKYGPRPDGGVSYYGNSLKGEPKNIGKAYTYQWFE